MYNEKFVTKEDSVSEKLRCKGVKIIEEKNKDICTAPTKSVTRKKDQMNDNDETNDTTIKLYQ